MTVFVNLLISVARKSARRLTRDLVQDTKAITGLLRCDYEVNGHRSLNDCAAIAQRLSNDYETNAQRLRIDCESIAKELHSDCTSIA
jgi:hypothetical protein